MPDVARIHVAFERLPDGRPAVTARPDDLKLYGIVVLRPREHGFPETRTGRDGETRHFDLERIYALSAERDTVITGVRIPARGTLAVAVHVMVPRDADVGPVRFEVRQQAGKEVVGGGTCVVRPRPGLGA